MTEIKLIFSTKTQISKHKCIFEIKENILNEMFNKNIFRKVDNTMEHEIDRLSVVGKRIKIELLNIFNTFKQNSVIEIYCNACTCCIGIFDNNNKWLFECTHATFKNNNITLL